MREIKIKEGEIVELTWFDAFGRGSWCATGDVMNGLYHPVECLIIGYFIKEDKNFYVLSMGLQHDPQDAPFLHLEFIPKGCVTKIKKLK